MGQFFQNKNNAGKVKKRSESLIIRILLQVTSSSSVHSSSEL